MVRDDSGSSPGHGFWMRRFVSLGAVIAVAVASAAAAGAAPRSASSLTGASSGQSQFCQQAASFAKDTNLLTLSASAMRADYAKFKAEAPLALSLAPSQIKAPMQQVFTFANTLLTELSKVGWNVSKLPRSFEIKVLAVQGAALRPASDKVIAYLDKNCGLKLPKP